MYILKRWKGLWRFHQNNKNILSVISFVGNSNKSLHKMFAKLNHVILGGKTKGTGKVGPELGRWSPCCHLWEFICSKERACPIGRKCLVGGSTMEWTPFWRIIYVFYPCNFTSYLQVTRLKKYKLYLVIFLSRTLES